MEEELKEDKWTMKNRGSGDQFLLINELVEELPIIKNRVFES